MSGYYFDEDRGLRDVDCVTRSAQFSHAVAKGPSISQRECAGLNWPPLPISASEPVNIAPEAVSRAGPHHCACTSMGVPMRRPCRAFTRTCRASWPAAVSELISPRGVCQPARWTFDPKPQSLPRYTPVASVSRCLRAQTTSGCVPGSIAQGVGQPANAAAWLIVNCTFDPSARLSECRSLGLRPPLPMLASGVGHPVVAVSDMRGADARSRKRDTPEGVTQGFHVSLYKVDPSVCALSRNLLSKDDCRAALRDEPVEGGPQVPLVSKPISFACRAERLAWAGSGPDRTVVGPSRETQGEAPHADSGEEVALIKSSKFIWPNIFDAPFVDLARRDQAVSHQLAQPCGGEGIVFVVVSGHHRSPKGLPR
jgi:hypothetical protein